MKGEEKKGISLIVLIITIVIIIILAVSIIVSFSKNNPVGAAKEATFKSNIDSLKTELDLFLSSIMVETLGEIDTSTISITKTGGFSNIGEMEVTLENDLPMISKIGMLGKLEVQNGKLVYLPKEESSLTDQQIAWLEQMDIHQKGIFITDEKYFTIDPEAKSIIGFDDERAYNDGIYEITIPKIIDGVEINYIGNEAFSRCYISKVTIPGHIFYIGTSAFANSGISQVVLEEGVKFISDRAFENTNITSVSFPESLEAIDVASFSESNLQNVEFKGNNLKYVGSGAFYFTPWENSQPDGPIYIGNILYDYKYTSGDVNLQVKEGTKFINQLAFKNINPENFISINIPSSVTRIGAYAFDFQSFVDIHFEDESTIEYIDAGAFSGTKYISSKTDPIIYIGKVLYKCQDSTITDVVIKEGTKSISFGAFRDKSLIKNITFPDSIIHIASNAFINTTWMNNQKNSGNKMLYIGKTLYKCFSDGSDGQVITIKDGTEYIGSDAIDISPEYTPTIIIPDSVKVIYPDAVFSKTTHIKLNEKSLKFALTIVSLYNEIE